MHLALWPNRRANPTDSLLSNPDPNALVLVVEVLYLFYFFISYFLGANF